MSDLTTAEGTLAYLHRTPYAASEVQRLSGGHSAFTYRIILKEPLPTGERTLVLKYYEGKFSDRELRLGAERGEFEYKALMAIMASNLFNSSSAVQTPRPIDYDPEKHAVFMTDLGSTVPLAYALASSPELSGEIGTALGDFMGRFHNWGAAPEQAELRHACSQNASAKSASYFRERIVSMMRSVKRFGLSEQWIEEFATKQSEVGFVRGDDEVLAIGDFWLDNVLVSMPNQNQAWRIYIIDWEMVLPTYAEFDMGEFIGTALHPGRKLYPQHDNRLVSAVLGAYRTHRELNPLRMAVETGAFAAGFGLSYTKPDDPFAKDTVLHGLELARLGWNGDERGVRKSLLREMFRGSDQVGCWRCELEACRGGCTTERTVAVL